MRPFHFTEIKRFFAVATSFAAAIFLFLQPAAACSWDYMIWENRAENAEPYYRFLKDGSAGFIDRTGRIVIEPTLRDMGNGQPGIINGLLKTDYEKYIDIKTGKEVSEDFYEQNTAPVNDWTAKSTNEGYGFVDRSGGFVIEPKYVYAKDFSEGFAPVVLEGPCFYESSGAVCPGASVFPSWTSYTMPKEACKFNFIDKKGKLISAQKFLDIKEFSEGLAAVKTEKGWGYLGKSGKLVIEPQFDSAETFSDGLARVERNGRFGYLNSAGAFVIEPQFQSAGSFSEGFALVGQYNDKTADNKFHYIDKKGKRLTNDIFLLGGDFFKGVAHVLVSETRRIEKKDGEESEIRTQTFAYINRKGERIFVYTDEDEM